MDPNQPSTNDQASARIHQALQLTQPQADFVSCLMGAVLASLPTFLAALMECLGGGNPPGTGEYRPGQRKRCP